MAGSNKYEENSKGGHAEIRDLWVKGVASSSSSSGRNHYRGMERIEGVGI